MKNKKGYLLCKQCKNYSAKKEYFSDKVKFRCKWNAKHKSQYLKCNKINEFFAFEPKRKNGIETRE